MGKTTHKPNAIVNKIFDDLEKLQDFCQTYGYRYNEGDLYNFKSYAYQQFNKFSQGKNAKDMWDQDLQRFSIRRS